MQHIFGAPIYIPTVTEALVVETISTLKTLKPFGYLILTADDDEYPASQLHDLLINSDIKFFGGVFPGIILNEEVKEHGGLIIPIMTEFEITIVEHLSELSNSNVRFPHIADEVQTSLVLVDGLATNIDIALTELFQLLGDESTVFGGGAGSLSFEQKPCLFTPHGVLQDAMLIVTMKAPCVLAIGHGWEILDGPYLANEVDGNTILQLNFQPAMQVYKEVVEQHSGKKFSDYDFFDIAQTYPFGLDRLDEKLLVRDPVTQVGDSLTCVGKIPENTMLYVLKGESSHLIKATHDAVDNCIKDLDVTDGILFNCISRQLLLKDVFCDELKGIAKPIQNNIPLVGALALGEIASGQSGCIDFHNKTAVMALTQAIS